MRTFSNEVRGQTGPAGRQTVWTQTSGRLTLFDKIVRQELQELLQVKASACDTFCSFFLSGTLQAPGCPHSRGVGCIGGHIPRQTPDEWLCLTVQEERFVAPTTVQRDGPTLCDASPPPPPRPDPHIWGPRPPDYQQWHFHECAWSQALPAVRKEQYCAWPPNTRSHKASPD